MCLLFTASCHYVKGNWSECDATTNIRSRILTLKDGDNKECVPTRTIQKKCKKGKFSLIHFHSFPFSYSFSFHRKIFYFISTSTSSKLNSTFIAHFPFPKDLIISSFENKVRNCFLTRVGGKF